MAGEIKQWQLSKVHSDRGYHIYRFGSLPIGLAVSNPGQHNKMLSYWYVKLSFLKEMRDKVYITGEQYPVDYSPGRIAAWRQQYAKQALNWLNENQRRFFDFVFDAAQNLGA